MPVSGIERFNKLLNRRTLVAGGGVIAMERKGHESLLRNRLKFFEEGACVKLSGNEMIVKWETVSFKNT